MSTAVAQSAPIVASVWKVLVAVGDVVERGAALAIVESMKMEIPVLATIDGVVESIPVEIGQIVQEGDPVVILAPAEAIPAPRTEAGQ